MKKVTHKILAEICEVEMWEIKEMMMTAFIESNSEIREKLREKGFKQYDY
jgi:hypothetical protein